MFLAACLLLPPPTHLSSSPPSEWSWVCFCILTCVPCRQGSCLLLNLHTLRSGKLPADFIWICCSVLSAPTSSTIGSPQPAALALFLRQCGFGILESPYQPAPHIPFSTWSWHCAPINPTLSTSFFNQSNVNSSPHPSTRFQHSPDCY